MSDDDAARHPRGEHSLLRKIRLVQEQEQEKKETVERFLAYFSSKDSAYSSSLLQDIYNEYSSFEQESINLSNKNAKLYQKISDQEKLAKDQESKHLEEIQRQEQRFNKMEEELRGVVESLRNESNNYENEISAKNHTIRRLEEDCSQLRISAGQFESKLDSMQSEMASLDSAMASLHGEISALQRELDDSEVSRKQLDEDLAATRKVENALSEEVSTLRQQNADGEKLREELELQLAEASSQREAMDSEISKRMETITSERDALQAALSKKDSKLKQQSATNQELNELVSKMHSDLTKEKQSRAKESEDMKEKNREMQAELDELKSSLVAAEEFKSSSTRQKLELEDKVASLNSKYSNVLSNFEAQSSEIKKYSKRLDRLEHEKQDLLMEISDKAQAHKDLQKSFSALKAKHDNAMDDASDKDNTIMNSKMSLEAKENEVKELQSEIRAMEERLDSSERQLKEEKQLKEAAQESNREQQREHAARIVESNQKNSRLGTELSTAQNTVESLKKQIIDASSLISNYEKEKEEMQKHQAATHSKLQSLEDMYEESAAKLEASDAELEDVKSKLGSALREHESVLEERQRNFNIELTNQQQKSKKEVNELRAELEDLRRQSEANLERSLSRARTSFQRQLEELQTAHHREVSDARNRVATVAAAMDSLQRELREECAKNSDLAAELEMLREANDSKAAEEDFARYEKDRAKERSHFENTIANLKSQLKSGSSNSSHLQQQLDAANKQALHEKEERRKAESRLQVAEEKLSQQSLVSEGLESEVFSLKRQLSESEKRMSYQLQQKSDEIQRVTRRNEVLSEAVTRLTQMGSADRARSEAADSAQKYTFDDSESSASRYDSKYGAQFQGYSHDGAGGRLEGASQWNSSYGASSEYSSLAASRPGHSALSTGDSSHSYHSARAAAYRSNDHHHPEEDTSQAFSGDVNSSLLRVQQALDSRKKQSHHSPGSRQRSLDSGGSHQRSSDRVLKTPERVSKSGRGSAVPRLDLDEYEKEIREDRTPPSSSNKESRAVFAERIRDEVEQGKDKLLPFSPKTKGQKNLGARRSPHSGSKTEREVVQAKKSTDRSLSAPSERKSREQLYN